MIDPFWTDGALTLYVGDPRDVLPQLRDLEADHAPMAVVTAPVLPWLKGWPAALASVLPLDHVMWLILSTGVLLDRWDILRALGYRFGGERIWPADTAGAAWVARRLTHGRARELYQGPLPSEEPVARTLRHAVVESRNKRRGSVPIAVAGPLIVNAVPPGAVVLDPFVTGGGVLRAASLLGRRGIGIVRERKTAGATASALAQRVLPQRSEQEELFGNAC